MTSPLSPPRRRDAVANRERLLVAATAVFAQEGVGAPLDAIAKQAQVSIGTLYNHFPTREQLLDAIYPARIAEIEEVAAAALADPDHWSGFRQFVTRVAELQATDRGLNDAMTLRYPDATALSAACDRGFSSVGDLIDRAQRSGDLRPDFTMNDLALLIWTTSRVIAATISVAPDAWRRHLEFHLDGLRADAAHPLSVDPLTTDQVAAVLRAPATAVGRRSRR